MFMHAQARPLFIGVWFEASYMYKAAYKYLAIASLQKCKLEQVYNLPRIYQTSTINFVHKLV